MKLLFDNNLSPRLVERLADMYPGSLHVETAGLERASDREVWLFARQADTIIVTKDSDFSDLSVMEGGRPQVIWLRLGNCTTAEVERSLRRHVATIIEFAANPHLGVLELV